MAWQLIYTSAPRGLAPGHSGFCAVARSEDLREAVAERLEQISSYHYLDSEQFSDGARNPTISAYRTLDVRGSRYHVLSRIQPSGLDFSSRTNHLAQHLLFEAAELPRLPSPAALLLHWPGWLTGWEGEPRLLERLTPNRFTGLPAPVWPAQAWRQLTGDAGRAAGLLESEYSRGCYLLCDPGGERQLLELFRETLQLLNPNGGDSARDWEHTFTTHLQAEDAPADFQWRGCRRDSPAWDQAVRHSVNIIRVQTIRAPNNSRAKLAREGPAPPAPPASPALRIPRVNRPAPSWKPPSTLSGKDLSRNVTRAPSARPLPGAAPHPPSRRTVGTIAIALVLLAGLAGIKHRWSAHKAPAALPAASALVPVRSNRAPAQVASALAAHPEPAEAPLAKEVGVAPDQARKLDSFHWQDAPIYVIIVPESTTEPIALPPCPPMESLLRQYDRIDVKPGDLDLRFNQESWDLSLKLPLIVDPRNALHKLAAKGKETPALDARLVCDYSGLLDDSADHPPVRVQFTADTGSPGAFSILFQPAAGGNFPPFRLLVVSESHPPRPLPLNRAFLRANAASVPEGLRAPLRQRLNQFHLGNAAWQLRPLLKARNGGSSKYLYQDWPAEEQPTLAASVDLAGERKRLESRLKERQADAARVDAEIQEAGDGFNFSLELGAILGITNQELATFNTFAESRRTTNRLASVYLEYLARLAKQPGPHHAWLEQWSLPKNRDSAIIRQELNNLYDLCARNLSDSAAKLTVSGPVSNYFCAAWSFLRQDDKQRQLAREIKTLNGRLAQVRLAYLSLCMDLAPNRWVPFIEFSTPAEPSP